LRGVCGYNPGTFKNPDKPRIVTPSLRLTLIILLCCGLLGCGQTERGFGRRGVFHLTAGVAALLLAGAALIVAARAPAEAAGSAAAVEGAGPTSAPWSTAC
jgi:hypothetical protein